MLNNSRKLKQINWTKISGIPGSCNWRNKNSILFTRRNLRTWESVAIFRVLITVDLTYVDTSKQRQHSILSRKFWFVDAYT